MAPEGQKRLLAQRDYADGWVIRLWPSATPTTHLWPVIVFLFEGSLEDLLSFGGGGEICLNDVAAGTW